VTVPDLFATVMNHLDIGPHKEFITAFDSPASAIDSGRVIFALLTAAS